MRQIFLLVSILLLGLSWAIAQDPNSSTSPSSSGQSSASSASRTSAGGENTVEGCLSGSSGNYTLTDKNGTTYQLTGDTAKLSQHVGHEVKVTGTEGAADSGSAGAAAGTAGAAGGQQTLQVTSVKHVAKTCKSGGGMTH